MAQERKSSVSVAATQATKGGDQQPPNQPSGPPSVGGQSGNAARDIMTVIEKKIRNLEKRKGRLEMVEKELEMGKEITESQRAALEKKEQVLDMLEVCRDFLTSADQIAKNDEASAKARLRKEQREAHHRTIDTIGKVMRLQFLLDEGLRREESDDNTQALEVFRQAVDEARLKGDFTKAAEFWMNVLDAKQKEFAPGLSYELMNEKLSSLGELVSKLSEVSLSVGRTGRGGGAESSQGGEDIDDATSTPRGPSPQSQSSSTTAHTEQQQVPSHLAADVSAIPIVPEVITAPVDNVSAPVVPNAKTSTSSPRSNHHQGPRGHRGPRGDQHNRGAMHSPPQQQMSHHDNSQQHHHVQQQQQPEHPMDNSSPVMHHHHEQAAMNHQGPPAHHLPHAAVTLNHHQAPPTGHHPMAAAAHHPMAVAVIPGVGVVSVSPVQHLDEDGNEAIQFGSVDHPIATAVQHLPMAGSPVQVAAVIPPPANPDSMFEDREFDFLQDDMLNAPPPPAAVAGLAQQPNATVPATASPLLHADPAVVHVQAAPMNAHYQQMLQMQQHHMQQQQQPQQTHHEVQQQQVVSEAGTVNSMENGSPSTADNQNNNSNNNNQRPHHHHHQQQHQQGGNNNQGGQHMQQQHQGPSHQQQHRHDHRRSPRDGGHDGGQQQHKGHNGLSLIHI